MLFYIIDGQWASISSCCVSVSGRGFLERRIKEKTERFSMNFKVGKMVKMMKIHFYGS